VLKSYWDLWRVYCGA